MPLSNELHDMDLSENETKLRDGIFNMNTRRFGKVAEYMIAKLYGFKIVQETTKYDLTDDNDIKIEVKFSKTEYTEEDMNLENCLKICMANANPVSRRIAYRDFLKNKEIKFDRNIEQIKAYEFDRLYYGLFFEDQIAIFSMTSEEMKNIMTAQFFISPQKSPKPSVDKVIELITNFPGRKRAIMKSIEKVRSKLQDIEYSRNQYAIQARKYIEYNNMIEPWNHVVLDIKSNGLIDKQQIKRILGISEKYLNFCDKTFAEIGQFPNISPVQHLGNEKAEGQMHINNENLEWHIEESGFFCGWLSYKDLYDLLKPEIL